MLSFATVPFLRLHPFLLFDLAAGVVGAGGDGIVFGCIYDETFRGYLQGWLLQLASRCLPGWLLQLASTRCLQIVLADRLFQLVLLGRLFQLSSRCQCPDVGLAVWRGCARRFFVFVMIVFRD